MPDTPTVWYRKNMYTACLSLKSVSKPYFIHKITPTRHAGYHAAITSGMVFHFPSPGVGRNMQDRPAWLPEYPAAPFHATAIPGRRSGCRVLRQRYHYHPDFKTACQRCPMPGMPLIFFLLLLRSLVPPASKSCHILLSRQIFLREALPPIIFQCPGCFVSLHTDIPFRQV